MHQLSETIQNAVDEKCYKIVLIVKPKLRLCRLPAGLHNNYPFIFTVIYVTILRQFEFKKEKFRLMENFETGESAAKLVTCRIQTVRDIKNN